VREAEVAGALEQLKLEYVEQARAFQLVEKAEGWQLATEPQYAEWVRQLYPAPKPARLSAPALETLAIIAYRQPIIRADVEAVRGVNIDGVLQTLMERGLVKIAGRAEIPGRPLLYETTQFFLDHFGLRNLDELPNVEELRKRDLPSARTSIVAIDDAGAPESTSPATAPHSLSVAVAPWATPPAHE
jgi:segregation and condensation protein B